MRRWVVVVAVVAMLVAACTGADGDEAATPTTQPVADFAGAPVVAWFDLTADMVESQRISPPVASRLYAYLAVTLHAAAHASAPLPLNGLPELPPPPTDVDVDAAVAAAAAAWLDDTFSRGLEQDQIAELRAAQLAQATEDTDAATVDASTAWGDELAGAVAAWAGTDGYTEAGQANRGYSHPYAEGGWERTPPGFVKALEPFWGTLRTFVVDPAECPLPEPDPYSPEEGSPLWNEAKAVQVATEGMTDEEEGWARFWDDSPGFSSTPPGHWVKVVGQAATQQGWDLETTTDAYLASSVALADAFIVGWQGKYDTDVIRPITYINRFIDPSWDAYLVTPPFPEYPSGHSIASATTAEALDGVVGAFPYEDATNLEFVQLDGPQRYASFPDAAREAALSRLYGGIHYPMGVDSGVEQGRCLGGQVVEVLGPALTTTPAALGNEPAGWPEGPVITAEEILAEAGPSDPGRTDDPAEEAAP